jgi:hypothetical protein
VVVSLHRCLCPSESSPTWLLLLRYVCTLINGWGGVSSAPLVRVLRPAAPALFGLGGAVASASPRRGRCLFLRSTGSLPSSFSDLQVSWDQDILSVVASKIELAHGGLTSSGDCCSGLIDSPWLWHREDEQGRPCPELVCVLL